MGFRNLETHPVRPAKTGKQYTPSLVLAIKKVWLFGHFFRQIL